jgi:alkyl sulfatase BDS1-like metallo-beta-lactamase superfamily hydrolase
MARFLSAAWFQQVQREQPAGPAGRPALTLQQVVTGTPDGEVRYQVVVADGRATVRPGSSPTPDMTFTSDYATATAIARGRLSVQAALSAGRIRVGGDTARLAEHQPLLGNLDPLPAALRADTSWPDDGDDG